MKLAAIAFAILGVVSLGPGGERADEPTAPLYLMLAGVMIGVELFTDWSLVGAERARDGAGKIRQPCLDPT
ncbi:MAG: hypothetical protein ACREOC_06270 [Gemmatimonadales bacterium]